MTRGQALQFSVNRRVTMPVYVQLKEQIRHLIAVGELGPGTRLPPAERLADNLCINRHTVLKAYQELAQQGYVESRNGVGSFVSGAAGAVAAEALPARVLPQLDVALQAALEQGMTPEQIAYLALTRAAALSARAAAAPPAVLDEVVARLAGVAARRTGASGKERRRQTTAIGQKGGTG